MILINFSDDMQYELNKLYREFCGDLHSRLKRLQDEVDDISANTKYAPLIQKVNTLIEVFNYDIKNESERSFDAWIDGSNNFLALSRRWRAGSSADNTAREMASNIWSIFNEFWSPSPLGSGFTVNMEEPNITDYHLEELKDTYRKCLNDTIKIREDVLRLIKGRAQDDATYNYIIDAVTALIDPVIKYLRSSCESINKNEIRGFKE